MRTLARAVETPQAIGQHLRIPWWWLESKVKLATKELLIVGAAPAGGKSTLAINWAMNVDYSVLYLAQDSAPSVLTRMVALAKDWTIDQAREALETEGGRERVAAEVAATRPNLVLESGAQDIMGIRARIEALHEWLGEPPRLVIVDNLIDLVVPGYQHGEMGFYATALPELKQVALDLDVCMLVLHHVVRKTADGKSVGAGGVPLKLTDLTFAGEREARHVWGVYHDQKSKLTVQILKQQDGQADRDGGFRETFAWVPELNLVRSY